MTKGAIIVPLFFTSCLCQFVMDFGMKPDVTFGDQNERFDVASIIRDQNRMLANEPEYRRHLENRRENNENDNNKNNDREKEKIKRENENNKAENKKDERENDKGGEVLDALNDAVESLPNNDFAYHDKMESSPDDGDYEKNLAAFQGKRRSLQDIVDHLHGDYKSGRRGIPPDPENEILFHYGVPVNMKIEGYVQVPLERR